jgi:hypothetical protein
MTRIVSNSVQQVQLCTAAVAVHHAAAAATVAAAVAALRAATLSTPASNRCAGSVVSQS